MKKVALFNDTRTQFHHGCELVMKQIEENLGSRNIEIHAISMEGSDWEKDERFQKLVSECDGIIVNGEGTIHHARAAGEKLLKASLLAEELKIPCFLINTTYQENPDEYLALLKKFNRIYVRETFSQKELENIGIESEVVPDLTLSYSFDKTNERGNIGVSDSSMTPMSELLFGCNQRINGRFMPVIRSSKYDGKFNVFESFRKFKFLLKNIKLKFINSNDYLQIRTLYLENTIEDFLNAVSSKKLIVSGRFHVNCFCLLTETPFITLEGNSHKVKSMLTDIGLVESRSMMAERLDEISGNYEFPFSNEELNAIKQYKVDAKIKIKCMFDEIVNEL